MITFLSEKSWMLSSIFINVHWFLGIKILLLKCPEIPDNVALLLCHWIKLFCMNLNALFWLHLGITESKCSGLILRERLGLGKGKSARNPGYQIGGFPCTCPCFPVLLTQYPQSNNILCFISCNYCSLACLLVVKKDVDWNYHLSIFLLYDTFHSRFNLGYLMTSYLFQ